MAGKKFSIEAIFSAVDRLSAPMAKIRGRLGEFGRGASRSLAALDARLGSVHGGIKRIAAASLAAGAAGGLAAFAIGKTGAEFEQAITAVAAVGLQTRAQISGLEAEAKRLGATTQFTATQAANAMETMSRAGFTTAEILAGVGSVLSGAAAEGIEIAEMAGHVSNALKGMGLETTDTARVVDVLALASARTNSSIGSLGESLSNVASTARQFKIPLEDTVAGVALLQDVGLDASVAGSALNVMLTQMAAPTDSIAEKMRRFGVTFKDANGNMLPFQEVLANISLAAKKSGGNMDQVAFMAELVGLRGQKAAANLADLFDSGKVQDLIAELKNAGGAAQKMAEIRMDNTIGDLTLLESAVDGVKVALFETQAGPLRGIIKGITQWVEANKSLIVFEFQVWLRWLQNNLPEIVTWLKRIGTALVAFYALAAAVKVARLAVLAFEIALKLATGVTWAWGVAMKAGRVAAYAVSLATNAVSLATIRSTIATGAMRLAQMASTAATALAAAGQWAYAAPLNVVSLATIRSTVATGALKVAQLAAAAAQWVVRAAVIAATAVQTAYAVVVGTSSGALGAFRIAALASIPAIAAQTLALAPLLITLGAVAAAATALALVWQQLSGLSKDLEGSGGITGTIGKMWEMGTLDPFKAHDAAMDEKARDAAFDRDARQMVTPGERAASEATAESVEQTSSVNGTITVEAKPGTKATVKAKPSKAPIVLKPSGAFP